MTLALIALDEDYFNPRAPWTHPAALGQCCARAGFHLIRRPALYPEFFNDEWLDPAFTPAIAHLNARL